MATASYRPHLMERHYASHLLQTKFQHPHDLGTSSLDKLDVEGSIHVAGADAVPFLLTSGAPKNELRAMWAVADPDGVGTLTRRRQFQILLRLIAMHEAGLLPPLHATEESPEAVYADALMKYGSLEIALPSFEGLATPTPTFLIANYGGDDSPTPADSVVAYGSGTLGGSGIAFQNQQQDIQASAFAMATDHDFQYNNWKQQQAIQSQQTRLNAPVVTESVQCLSVSDAFGALVDVQDKLLPSDDFGDFTDAPDSGIEATQQSGDLVVPSNEATLDDLPHSFDPSSADSADAFNSPTVSREEVVPTADGATLQRPVMNSTTSDQFPAEKGMSGSPTTALFSPTESPLEADGFGDFEGTAVTTPSPDLGAEGEREEVSTNMLDNEVTEATADANTSFPGTNSLDPFVAFEPSTSDSVAKVDKDNDRGSQQFSSKGIRTGEKDDTFAMSSNPRHTEDQHDSFDDFGNFEGVASESLGSEPKSGDGHSMLKQRDGVIPAQNESSYEMNSGQVSFVPHAKESEIDTRCPTAEVSDSNIVAPPGVEAGISGSDVSNTAVNQTAVTSDVKNEDFGAFEDAGVSLSQAPVLNPNLFSESVGTSGNIDDDPFAHLSGAPEMPVRLDGYGEKPSCVDDNLVETSQGSSLPDDADGSEMHNDSFGTFEGAAAAETSFEETVKSTNKQNEPTQHETVPSPLVKPEISNTMVDTKELSTARQQDSTMNDNGKELHMNGAYLGAVNGGESAHQSFLKEPSVAGPSTGHEDEDENDAYVDPFGHLSVAPESKISGDGNSPEKIQAEGTMEDLNGVSSKSDSSMAVGGGSLEVEAQLANQVSLDPETERSKAASNGVRSSDCSAGNEILTGLYSNRETTSSVDPFAHLSGSSEPQPSSNGLNHIVGKPDEAVSTTCDDQSAVGFPPLLSTTKSTREDQFADPFAHLSQSNEQPPLTLTMLTAASGKEEPEDDFGTFQDVGTKVAGASVADLATVDEAEQFVEVSKMNQTQTVVNLFSATEQPSSNEHTDDNDDDEFVLVSDQVTHYEDHKVQESPLEVVKDNVPTNSDESFKAFGASADRSQRLMPTSPIDPSQKDDNDDFGDFETHTAENAASPADHSGVDLLGFASADGSSPTNHVAEHVAAKDFFTSLDSNTQSQPGTSTVFDAAFDASLLQTNAVEELSGKATETLGGSKDGAGADQVSQVAGRPKSTARSANEDDFADFQAFEEAAPDDTAEPDKPHETDQPFEADFGDFSEPQQATANSGWGGFDERGSPELKGRKHAFEADFGDFSEPQHVTVDSSSGGLDEPQTQRRESVGSFEADFGDFSEVQQVTAESSSGGLNAPQRLQSEQAFEADFGDFSEPQHVTADSRSGGLDEPQQLQFDDISSFKVLLQGMKDEVAAVLNPPAVLLARSESDSGDFKLLSFVEKGLELMLADANSERMPIGFIRWRVNRCLTLHKLIAKKQHRVTIERWFDVVDSVTTDLELCCSLFREMHAESNLTRKDQDQICQSEDFSCFLCGLGEAVRVVRCIAAVVGDLLFLDERTELTRDSLNEWGSLVLLEKVLGVEDLWLEIVEMAASAKVRRMPRSIETVAEIRKRVSAAGETTNPPTYEVSNHFCHITLHLLPQLLGDISAEPVREPMLTLTSSGMTFMAGALNYCLNRLSSSLCL